MRGAVLLGPRTRAEVYMLTAGAAVTLMPVRWDEPFGLVAVSSLAAGMEAFQHGAMTDSYEALPRVTARPRGGASAPAND